MIAGIYTFNLLMDTDARKCRLNKEGQDKTWIINDESDTMSSLFNLWEYVHCVSQIAAKSPRAVKKKNNPASKRIIVFFKSTIELGWF